MATGTVTAARRLTVDEFLDWAIDQPGRHELEDGRVVVMSPERVGHLRVKGAVQAALSSAIKAARLPCEALPDGATVRIGRGTAYEPDALVHCGPKLPGDSVEVPNPVIVIEILSPSTAYRDVSAKLAGYFRLPSIAHYLIVDSDRRMVVHHAREEGAPIRTRILTEGRLVLDPPGLDLAVEDLLGEPDADG